MPVGGSRSDSPVCGHSGFRQPRARPARPRRIDRRAGPPFLNAVGRVIEGMQRRRFRRAFTTSSAFPAPAFRGSVRTTGLDRVACARMPEVLTAMATLQRRDLAERRGANEVPRCRGPQEMLIGAVNATWDSGATHSLYWS